MPPGVDHPSSRPRDRDDGARPAAPAGLRLPLFVGRLQPHKGPDVAIRALAEAVARSPDADAATPSSRSSAARAASTHDERSLT